MFKEIITYQLNCDQRFHGTERHQIGLVEVKLNSYGDLQCLVLGQFGEGSQHVHDLASQKAATHSRSLGRPASDHERASFLHHYRRHLGIRAVRAQAQCLLARTGHLEQGAKDTADRRQVARNLAERSRGEMRAHWEAHVRGRRLHRIGGLHLH